MTDAGPWGGRNNCALEDGRRVLALIAVFALLVLAAALGLVSVAGAFAVGTIAFILWLWLEYQIESQARRDLMTDLSQNIHDENNDASDLRRARGYAPIEDRLERAEEDDDG